MIAYFRLIRLPNLLMIALAQGLVRYCIIIPAFQTEFLVTDEFPQHLSKINFVLLVFSTILISAAGYIINDVFDVYTDEINKPGKNVIGTKIQEKTAKLLYYILSACGVVIGFYLAWKIEKPVMGFVHLFTAVSLWMYSSYYKRRMLSGNVLISLLVALSLLTVGLFEPEFYRNFVYLLIFAGFAFAVTLIREVIKDMEDVEGDERTQCKTLPVRIGLDLTKQVVYQLILVTGIVIAYVLYKYFYDNRVISYWYLVAMFEIPFAALAYLVYSAGEKKDYYYASMFSKGIMILGICSMIPFYYYFLK